MVASLLHPRLTAKYVPYLKQVRKVKVKVRRQRHVGDWCRRGELSATQGVPALSSA